MSLNQIARRRTRGLAAGLVAGLVLAGLATATGGAAQAVQPAGSRGVVQIETGDATGIPANALTSGWWGHEGGANNGTGTGSTFPSFDISDDGNPATVTDPSIAAAMATLGAANPGEIGYAIVPYSANGSNERPLVTAGEDAASAFANQASGTSGAILYAGFGTSFNGNANPNDGVTIVSTYTEVHNWYTGGHLLQSFDNSLFLHDATSPGAPLSANPKGKSILNAWPAGTQLSLVAFVTDGTNAALGNYVPNVKVGGDGHALTAWLPITTVAKPGDATRSSAGYVVVGPYAPTVALSATYSAGTGTLTATLKKKDGTVATDATGSVEFAPVVGGTTGTATPVAAASGKAVFPVAGLTAGTSKTFDVRYVPDVPAQASYLTTGYSRITLIGPTATATSLTAVGGATDTFTAKVSPSAAGTVVFRDGASTLATVAVAGGTAKYAKKLAIGKHVITASFTPTSPTYAPSSATKTVFQGRITTTLSPRKGRHGVRPKVTIKIVATGATVSGKVTIVFDPPTGATKRITVTLVHGAKTVTLPATVKGKTKITAMYLGNSQVLAANGAPVTFTAT